MRILSKKMKKDVGWAQEARNKKLIGEAKEFKRELEEAKS